ncbi:MULTISPECIES: hypothetical protein [unclassified Mesobacillus]|jgi:tetrahydromethanopterin S-methyltransferase subunit D|uniref:hypothetical protein n=1 Tax=unclassified Mesobacillus TaxID=2675270 RepID=UPI00203A4F40|nr:MULTISPECIES: hypothetical protein [unclassified Mesobacillus]MCM3124594.1 hypothetical protein [Mesobacillus sp. MER 33]MCM3234696.1 hypothetical protein [Mesobacillus sp. MER 48]
MDKKRAAFFSIFLFLAVNVVALSNAIEGYYGQEDERVYGAVIVALISTILATTAFFIWRKAEYKK